MPNWCLNKATITHDDPAKLTELVDAYKRGKLMEHYLPTPRDPNDPTKLIGEGKQVELGGFDWYNFRLNKWGTKWDIGGKDAFYDDTPEGLVLSFDTAWSPPIEFYSFLKDEHGFDIRASYFEPGMEFCGDWVDGVDTYWEGGIVGFPEHLIDEYDMEEFYAEDEEAA